MADSDVTKMKGWIDTFAEDTAVVRKVVEQDKAPRDARRLAAGALNYLVTRMDLIPDWEETCGILDDAMVLRVAMSLAIEKNIDESIDGETMRGVARLANEADVVVDFLGTDLYPRFKRYTEGLAAQVVRGRHPDSIIDDQKVRTQLFKEIGEEMSRLPPAPMSDPGQVARTIKNYMGQKLR
jgi:uncharacterized membrane protein YkvA (DUF1232 family)